MIPDPVERIWEHVDRIYLPHEKEYLDQEGRKLDKLLTPVVAPIRRQTVQVRRNAPCPCRSGRKYKQCCPYRVSGCFVRFVGRMQICIGY